MRYKTAAHFGELVLKAMGEAPESNTTPRRPALARITRAISSPSRYALIAAGAVAIILIISFVVWTRKDKEKQAAVPVTEQKKGGDSGQARSENDRAKIVRENTAKLLVEILPSDSPLKQSLDPGAVTKELDTRAAQGDQRIQLALGLIRVYGHDRFVRNATLSGRHFVGEPKTPLQRLLKTSGTQADGKAHGFYFSEEAAAAYREYFSESGSMQGAAWLKDLASRGCVPAQAHWAQVLSGSPFRYQWAQNNEIGGIQKNAGEAFEWAQKAASGGHPRGHLILGNYYSTGIPGKLARDGISALKHWTIAAEQGLPQAQLSLAKYFEESVPKAPRDPVRSYMWANITVGTPTDSWDEMFYELMGWSMAGRSAMGIMSGMVGQPDPELPILPREGLPRYLTDRKQAEAESMAREWRTRFPAANRKSPVPWHQMSCQ